MNLSAPFIRRPIATTLIMLGIVLFGALAYPQLPVSDLPSVDYPVINVRASLPGASPQTVAAALATPLEKQFSTISGLETMTSSSSLGGTNITLQFTLSRSIDAAADKQRRERDQGEQPGHPTETDFHLASPRRSFSVNAKRT